MDTLQKLQKINQDDTILNQLWLFKFLLVLTKSTNTKLESETNFLSTQISLLSLVFCCASIILELRQANKQYDDKLVSYK